MAAAEEEMGDAVGLVGGLDEHFFYAADVVAEGIVSFGADDFCGVQHGCSFVVRMHTRAKKKPGPEDGAGHGRAEIALVTSGRASPPCPRLIRRSSEPILAWESPALADLVVFARPGGDFRVPNWTTAPLRCAGVL